MSNPYGGGYSHEPPHQRGRRGGRRAAITGIVVGLIGLAAGVAALVGLSWPGTDTVIEDEARVGQCVDVSGSLGDIDLRRAECDEPHDAEIIAVGTFDQHLLRRYTGVGTDEFCAEVTTADRYLVLRGSGDYRVSVSTDALGDGDPQTGDAFVCFLARTDGERITVPLG